jgi:macrolide-specific efflux system membrane fusion protein
MKKILIAAIVLAALGGTVWGLRKKIFKRAPIEAVAVKATEASIEETVEATGSVSPLNRVEIKPTMSGRIEKLLVDEGATVKQGQIIAWMSSTDRAAILDGARAQGPEALKKWQDTYKATPIIAPLPGLIILNNVVEGQTIDTTVVIYAMSDLLIVVAQVDESDIGKIHIGMPARVVLDSYPDRKETGKVFDILYEGKNVSNVIQYGVKIKLDKVPAPAYYRSQMTANISFIVRKKEKALLVPASAVRVKDGVKQVLVPNPEENGRDLWQDVKTGIENDTSVEVVEGLNPGDTVLVRQAKYTPQQALANSPLTAAPPSGRVPGGGGGRGGGH